MILKRLKKISKLMGLIAVRQVVFLGKNVYNLINLPMVTIREIVEKKDKSQIFLLILVIMSPAIVYTMARIVWDGYRYGGLLKSLGPVFTVFFVIESVVLIYISYWVYQVFRKK